jgi:exonuclease SbcC
MQTADCKTLESKINDSQTILDRIGEELRVLKADFEAFPVFKSKLTLLEEEIVLLTRLENELLMTSEELRKRIVPNASFVVNQILPLLTTQRYSNFEIADDFMFKAYSAASGSYEQIGIFSGGTRDQFLLALRLAFSDSLLGARKVKDDNLCIMLDDVLSTSDEMRKMATVQMLRAMQTSFSQIIVAAHDDLASNLDYAIILAKDENGFTRVDWCGRTS